MTTLPAIQIRQQYARIGMDSVPARLSIRQPQAELSLTTAPAAISIHSEPGTLRIDQSRAWDALGMRNALASMDRIHAEARNVAWDHVARIVQQGDRLADLTSPGNTIAEIGKEEALKFREFNYLTEPSTNNVEVAYTPSPPVVDVREGRVETEVQVHKPEIDYIRGKLDIYVAQQAALTVIPPQLDIKV